MVLAAVFFLEIVTVFLPLKLLLRLYWIWYPVAFAFFPHLMFISPDTALFSEEMEGLATR